jgi:hypothetical protein
LKERLDGGGLHADDGGHTATAHLAHDATPFAHQREAGAKVEGTRREQGVVFAEAVAGDEPGRRGAVVHAGAVRQGVDDEERGLRELGQTEFAARVVHAEITYRIAEHVVGG